MVLTPAIVPPDPIYSLIVTVLISNTERLIISSRTHFTSRASIVPDTVRFVTVVFSIEDNKVDNDPAVVTLIVLETCE